MKTLKQSFKKLSPSEIGMFVYLERFSMTGDFEEGSFQRPASVDCADKNQNLENIQGTFPKFCEFIRV